MWFPILNIGKVLTDNLLQSKVWITKIGGYWKIPTDFYFISQKSVGIGKYPPMFDIFNIYQFLLNQRHHWTLLKKTTFATLQCEYRESGSEVLVNTDLVLRNWSPIPTSGLRPSVGIGPQFLRTSVCIYRYLLSRLTVFPQSNCGLK